MNSSIYFATLVEWMGAIAVTLILGLSARFIRRPLQFKYPQREGWVSLGLAAVGTALAAVVGVALLAGNTPAVLPADFPIQAGAISAERMPTLAWASAAVALLLALPFAVALVVRGQPLLSTGLGRQTFKPSIQLGLALALVTILVTNRTATVLDGINNAEVFGLLAAVVVGFSEEFVFRGFILPRLSAWLGERGGWLASAALFALWRLPLLLLISRQAPDAVMQSLIYTFLFGLLLGWMQRKAGHILAPGLYHAIHNWVQVLGLFG